jgi:putative ABC transport system substrate-binding protein
MDRRRFLLTSLAGALGAPPGANAQQAGKVWRIALLGLDGPAYRPLEQALQELGWLEGQNIAVERRFSQDYDRLAEFARDLVRLQVDVIVAGNAPAVRAAKTATQTIPIVMAPTGDPVSAGFVSSLARPGGNITGVAIMHTELSGKRLEFLTAAVPGVKRVAILANPKNPSTPAMSMRRRNGGASWASNSCALMRPCPASLRASSPRWLGNGSARWSCWAIRSFITSRDPS